MRFLFYSHDGLGLGHTRRNMAIATALLDLAPEAAVLLVTGIEEAPGLQGNKRVATLKLPSLRKLSNGSYVGRNLQLPGSEIRDLRAAILKTTVESFKPSVVLVDKHPFGVQGEFRAGLEAHRAQGGRAILGLRDILDESVAVRNEWEQSGIMAAIPRLYDQVLIYGQQTLFDPVVSYAFTQEVATRTRFCGYVVNHERARQEPGNFKPRSNGDYKILATTGGGEDGFELLQTFIRAATGAHWRGIAVAGPMAPETEFKTLAQMAEKAGVEIQGFVPSLPTMFGSVDAIVGMGGYNTLAEAASHGMPMVCVPRVAPRQEQLMRAEIFQRLGLLTMLEPGNLTPERLRTGIDQVVQAPRKAVFERANELLNFDGAQKAADCLLACAQA